MLDRRFFVKTLGAVMSAPLAALKYTAADGSEILQPVTDIEVPNVNNVNELARRAADGRLWRVAMVSPDDTSYSFEGFAQSFTIRRDVEEKPSYGPYREWEAGMLTIDMTITPVGLVMFDEHASKLR